VLTEQLGVVGCGEGSTLGEKDMLVGFIEGVEVGVGDGNTEGCGEGAGVDNGDEN